MDYTLKDGYVKLSLIILYILAFYRFCSVVFIQTLEYTKYRIHFVIVNKYRIEMLIHFGRWDNYIFAAKKKL